MKCKYCGAEVDHKGHADVCKSCWSKPAKDRHRKVTVPTVHLNGTSEEALLDQLREVGSALRNTLDKLRDAWPNQRDYYVDPDPDAYKNARDEAQSRTDRVTSVLTEVVAIAIEIQDRKEGR